MPATHAHLNPQAKNYPCVNFDTCGEIVVRGSRSRTGYYVCIGCKMKKQKLYDINQRAKMKALEAKK